jgi:hypothetical protein
MVRQSGVDGKCTLDPTDPKFGELVRRAHEPVTARASQCVPGVSLEDAAAMRLAAEVAQVVFMQYRGAGSPYGGTRDGMMRWLVERLSR